MPRHRRVDDDVRHTIEHLWILPRPRPYTVRLRSVCEIEAYGYDINLTVFWGEKNYIVKSFQIPFHNEIELGPIHVLQSVKFFEN